MLAACKTALAACKTTVAAYKTALAACKTTVTAYKTALAAYKTTLAAYRTTLAAYKTTLAAHKTTLAACKTTLAAYKTALAACKTALAAYKTTLAANKTTLAANKTATCFYLRRPTARNDWATGRGGGSGLVPTRVRFLRKKPTHSLCYPKTGRSIRWRDQGTRPFDRIVRLVTNPLGSVHMAKTSSPTRTQSRCTGDAHRRPRSRTSFVGAPGW